MKTNLFSPIFIILIVVLFAKASMLFGRIQEQTTESANTNAYSILVDAAFAKTSSSENHKENTKPKADKKIVSTAHSIPQSQKMMRSAESKAINGLTRSEIKLLKELSKRREQLEKEQRAFKSREQILQATENKIDQKVDKLKSLQTQIEELMKQYKQKEHSKILSLVKIYETMKPKDASKIFNDLEMPVLLKLVSNMKEVKVAPIIASMQPAKARELSIALAQQKPIE